MAKAKISFVENMPIDELTPYAKNARTHSPEHVTEIAASMSEFGFTNPVLIDGKGGIVAGHGRILAAQELGIKEVPCIRLTGLTAKQRRAYVIADNKIAMNSGWDFPLLAKEISKIGIDPSLLGFSNIEMDSLKAFLDSDMSTPESEEWAGMPEFKNTDKSAFKSVVVHFKDQESVDRFAGIVAAKITEKTRYIWYPEIEIVRYTDKIYKDTDES